MAQITIRMYHVSQAANNENKKSWDFAGDYVGECVAVYMWVNGQYGWVGQWTNQWLRRESWMRAFFPVGLGCIRDRHQIVSHYTAHNGAVYFMTGSERAIGDIVRTWWQCLCALRHRGQNGAAKMVEYIFFSVQIGKYLKQCDPARYKAWQHEKL